MESNMGSILKCISGTHQTGKKATLAYMCKQKVKSIKRDQNRIYSVGKHPFIYCMRLKKFFINSNYLAKNISIELNCDDDCFYELPQSFTSFDEYKGQYEIDVKDVSMHVCFLLETFPYEDNCKLFQFVIIDHSIEFFLK
jgi:hypothetical protein